LVETTLGWHEPTLFQKAARSQHRRDFVTQQTAIFRNEVMRRPFRARLGADVKVQYVPHIVNPIPDLMNDPPFSMTAIECRFLDGGSLPDERVVISNARNEQSAWF
jgi:hypothetical protein